MLRKLEVALCNDSQVCKYCRGTLVYDSRNGEQVCPICGVVSDMPKLDSEYSGGNDHQYVSSRDRDSPSTTMAYDMDLPASIDYSNVDAHGRNLPKSYELHRLRQINNFTISRDPKRRNLSKAIDVMKQAAQLLNLGAAVVQDAYRIYSKWNGAAENKRKPITGVALASVYVACKQLGIARSTREIEETMKEISAKSIRRYCNILLRQENMRFTMQDASGFVSRIAAKAGLDVRVERKAISILSLVRLNPVMMSRKPISLAAASIYVAAEFCGKPTTQLRIAAASDVTPITIRKRSNEILGIIKDSQEQGWASIDTPCCGKNGQSESTNSN